MVGGAGERPVKAPSPALCARPDGPPLGRTVARLASEGSTQKKAPTDLPAVPEIACVRYQGLRRECGSVRIGSGVCVRLEQGDL